MKLRLSSKIKLTENDIKRQVKDYLSIKGYFHFHILQGLGAFKGIPDRVAIKDGRVIFLEMKAPGKRQSEHQKKFQDRIEKTGGEYHVISSLEEIMKILEL